MNTFTRYSLEILPVSFFIFLLSLSQPFNPIALRTAKIYAILAFLSAGWCIFFLSEFALFQNFCHPSSKHEVAKFPYEKMAERNGGIYIQLRFGQMARATSTDQRNCFTFWEQIYKIYKIKTSKRFFWNLQQMTIVKASFIAWNWPYLIICPYAQNLPHWSYLPLHV